MTRQWNTVPVIDIHIITALADYSEAGLLTATAMGVIGIGSVT